MYLLVLLLLSPALGRPSSGQSDFVFNDETGVLWEYSKLFENVSQSLQEEEQNIFEMEAELKSLRSRIPDLQSDVNFFQGYHTAKSYLKETRIELRQLAQRSVNEVRDLKILLEDLDENAHPVLLKITILRMNDLMIETQQRFEVVKEKYELALEAFQNLITFVSHFVTRLEDYGGRYYIDNQIKDKFRERKENIGKYINSAIGGMVEEINLISGWVNNAKLVSLNIDRFPEEYLEKYQSVRNVFKTGLDGLENIAERFLDHPGPEQLYNNYLYRLAEAEKIAQRTNVAENLLEAERNILEVRALKHAVEEEYFPAYNEAKSILKETRQELMELAESTRTKVRDLKLLLQHLGEISNNSLLLKSFIDRMKDMKIDPLEMLKESRATYESAVKTFENTNSFIATKIRELERTSVSSRVTESGQHFEKTLKVLIDILHEEIEMITIWTKSAKAVSRNIENNSEDHLRQFQSVKTIFINGLDDLENATNTFLDQQMEIIKLKE